MLVLFHVKNHNGSSDCLGCLLILLCTISIFPLGGSATNSHNLRRKNGLVKLEAGASKAAPTTSHDPMPGTRDTIVETLALSNQSLNTTGPRPRVLSAYAMLIPSQAHADLLTKIILEIREAAIEALEPAIAPMKLIFSFGTIVFHIWLLAAKAGIVTVLADLFELLWMVTSPMSLLATEVAFAGSVMMWIELGGNVHPGLLDRRSGDYCKLVGQ